MSRHLVHALRIALLLPFFLVSGLASAQGKGTFEQIEVYGPSLAGNLSGDDPNRDVFVYLPPSYASSPNRRYPVIYFLHGYGATAQAYVNLMQVPDSIDEAIADGLREMIVVLPDANTLFNGSMYSSSPTTGDWEGFVADDLVGYIDGHYRTTPDRMSRGLAGHSMGGYGTLRIGMKRPEVFGSIYAMSSCCLMNQAPSAEAVAQQRERTANGPPQGGRGFANAPLAQAAAWSPNPTKPPIYVDWPYENGQLDPIVAARWPANSPLVFVDQYVPALKSFSAISMDVGDADTLMATNVQLSEALDRLGVGHHFEVYEGDHGNRVGTRFKANVLPFFAEHLD